jgi:hypothetical protein
MTTSIIERPIAGRRVTSLIRRLQRAQLGGWLVRVHLSSCGTATGSAERIDRKRWTFAVEHPGMVQGCLEYELDDIADLEILVATVMVDGHRIARLAQVAPWRSGDDCTDHFHGDMVEGTVAVGSEVVVLLADGLRRRGCLVSERGGRVVVHLRPGAETAPLAGFQPERTGLGGASTSSPG